MNLTWAITVCNELAEITNLLNFLQTRIPEGDEILIQYDEQGVTPEVLEYLNIMDKMHENHRVIGFPLNKDFASFKNNLIKHATKDYIVQVDADEIPHEFFVENIHTVLETNPVDLVFIPRVNTVEGLTPQHIQKWRWNVNEKGWVNYPDYQTRVYKRTDDIQWMNKVHERITGYDTFSNFPPAEEWSFYHHKDITRQEKQNAFYETI
jgi:glycosyltransferase involved in cell wall biosynthesis